MTYLNTSKKWFTVYSLLLVSIFSTQAATINFNDLGASLTNAANTLTSTGAGTATVTGATDGSNPDYLYSVSMTDFNFDGDLTNDTLTFNVRVSSVSGSSATRVGLGTSSATIGATPLDTAINTAAATGSPDMWVPGAADSIRFSAGDSLVFTIETIVATGSTSLLSANFLGFSGALVTERGASNHSFVMGSGSNLNGYLFSGASQQAVIAGSAVQTLYISSTTSAGSTNGNFGVNNVDFSFNVSVVPEPSSLMLLALGFTGLLFRRPRRHNHSK